jgi:SM-20-related protein
MVSFESVRGARFRDDPFVWGAVRGVVEPGVRAQLVSEFPESGFEHMRRTHGSDKQYEGWFRALRKPDGDHTCLDGLSRCWQEFVSELESSAYRAAMSACTGFDLANDLLELTLWRLGPSHFLSPHTDIRAKRLAHLIYFNPDWLPQWGGCLRILRSNNIDDHVVEFAPTCENSIVLVRSENSWHGVTRVTGTVSERKVLQISFWKESPVQGPHVPGLEVLGVR